MFRTWEEDRLGIRETGRESPAQTRTYLPFRRSDRGPARVDFLIDAGQEILGDAQCILQQGEVGVVLGRVLQQVLKDKPCLSFDRGRSRCPKEKKALKMGQGDVAPERRFTGEVPGCILLAGSSAHLVGEPLTPTVTIYSPVVAVLVTFLQGSGNLCSGSLSPSLCFIESRS